MDLTLTSPPIAMALILASKGWGGYFRQHFLDKTFQGLYQVNAFDLGLLIPYFIVLIILVTGHTQPAPRLDFVRIIERFFTPSRRPRGVARQITRGIGVEICGEAAGEVELVPVLIGLGVDELSVAPSRLAIFLRAQPSNSATAWSI